MSHHMHADFPCLVHSPLLRGGSSLIYSWLKSLPVPWWLPRAAVSIPSRLLPPPFSLTSGEFSELTATFQHWAKFQENGDDLKTKIQLSKVSQLQRERHTTRDCFHLQNKYMLRNLNFNVRATVAAEILHIETVTQVFLLQAHIESDINHALWKHGISFSVHTTPALAGNGLWTLCP